MTKESTPTHQYNSLARKYLNRFAIEEDDQFEIHVNDYKDYVFIGENYYKAAEEVIKEVLKEHQG